MSRPVAFRRFSPGTPADPRGEVPIDADFKPLSANGCDLLLNVWIGRLNRQEYSSIDLRLENGQLVSLKRLTPKHWPAKDIWLPPIGNFRN